MRAGGVPIAADEILRTKLGRHLVPSLLNLRLGLTKPRSIIEERNLGEMHSPYNDLVKPERTEFTFLKLKNLIEVFSKSHFKLADYQKPIEALVENLNSCIKHNVQFSSKENNQLLDFLKQIFEINTSKGANNLDIHLDNLKLALVKHLKQQGLNYDIFKPYILQMAAKDLLKGDCFIDEANKTITGFQSTSPKYASLIWSEASLKPKADLLSMSISDLKKEVILFKLEILRKDLSVSDVFQMFTAFNNLAPNEAERKQLNQQVLHFLNTQPRNELSYSYNAPKLCSMGQGNYLADLKITELFKARDLSEISLLYSRAKEFANSEQIETLNIITVNKLSEYLKNNIVSPELAPGVVGLMKKMQKISYFKEQLIDNLKTSSSLDYKKGLLNVFHYFDRHGDMSIIDRGELSAVFLKALEQHLSPNGTKLDLYKQIKSHFYPLLF
jgi:hypothetical protein